MCSLKVVLNQFLWIILNSVSQEIVIIYKKDPFIKCSRILLEIYALTLCQLTPQFWVFRFQFGTFVLHHLKLINYLAVLLLEVQVNILIYEQTLFLPILIVVSCSPQKKNSEFFFFLPCKKTFFILTRKTEAQLPNFTGNVLKMLFQAI